MVRVSAQHWNELTPGVRERERESPLVAPSEGLLWVGIVNYVECLTPLNNILMLKLNEQSLWGDGELSSLSLTNARHS